jgi:hypothetical protein
MFSRRMSINVVEMSVRVKIVAVASSRENLLTDP